MWKRDEGVRPAGAPSAPAGHQPPAPAPQPPTVVDQPVGAPRAQANKIERDVVNIGKSVVIKGELSGSEDLTIEGQVEGKIELRGNVLTIGPNGKIKAQVFAKAVIVLGEVIGNVDRLREGRHPRQRQRRRRSRRRPAWPLPKVHTSAAASTCSAAATSRARPSRVLRPATRRPKTRPDSRSPSALRPPRPSKTDARRRLAVSPRPHPNPSGLARIARRRLFLVQASAVLRVCPGARPGRTRQQIEGGNRVTRHQPGLTDLFARWGTRRSEDAARPHEKTVTTTATNEKTLGTKAFGKFLSALSNRESPVLLDLGPVVGNNINFLANASAASSSSKTSTRTSRSSRKEPHQRAGRVSRHPLPSRGRELRRHSLLGHLRLSRQASRPRARPRDDAPARSRAAR